MSGYSTTTGNRITSDGTWNYTHDNEGNINQKTHISSGEVWLYSWDHNNRLTKVERKPSSGGAVDLRVEFAYDVFGNRVQKSLDSDGDGAGTATVTKYGYDPDGNAWADLNASGSLTRRLYQDAVDTVFARIGASGNEDVYLTDNKGSVRDILDSSGTLIDNIDYASFGKVIGETNPSNGDAYQFAGFEVDNDIGLARNGARWYNFDIGLWMSKDPIGFAGGDTHEFRYVHNSPSNFTDPTGLSEVTQIGFTQGQVTNLTTLQGVMARRDGRRGPLTDPIRDDVIRIRAAAELERLTSTRSFVPPPGQPTRFLSLMAEPVEPGSGIDLEFLRDVIVGMIPYVGDSIDAYEASTGLDFYTGDSLSPAERIITASAMGVPLVGGRALRRLGRGHHGVLGSSRHLDYGPRTPAAHGDPRAGGSTGRRIAADSEGVIYLRTDHTTGREYVGQARSEGRYVARRTEHTRAHPDADFEFTILERAEPGPALDVAEESWIRAGGGPRTASNPGGRLENRRWQMNDRRYRGAGGSVSRH